MRTMAYLHPTADHCVTTAPQGYDNPRLLVLRSEAEALALQCYSLQMQVAKLKASLADMTDYAERFSKLNEEPLDGNCEASIAKAKELLA